jgi:hypothetical protein
MVLLKKDVSITWVKILQNKHVQGLATAGTASDLFFNINAMKLKVIRDGEFQIMEH